MSVTKLSVWFLFVVTPESSVSYLDANLNICVAMPLHDGQVGSLSPSGRPPTQQVSPAGYMFLCSPTAIND